MANPTTGFGLRPVRHLSGGGWNGAVQRVWIDGDYAVALYIGDPVLLNPTAAYQDPTGNCMSINLSAGTAGTIVVGCIVGFEPLRTDLTKMYNPASTDRYAYITTPDPGIVYHIRGDASGVPSKNWVGANAAGVAGTNSTVTGLSGFFLDETTPAATQNMAFHIIGLAPLEGNELGTSAIWEVTLNTSWNTTGNTAGVLAA